MLPNHTDLRAFERKQILIQRNFGVGFKIYVKMPCKRVSLSMGPVGNLDGVCRDIREKRKNISGLLSWIQRALI